MGDSTKYLLFHSHEVTNMTSDEYSRQKDVRAAFQAIEIIVFEKRPIDKLLRQRWGSRSSGRSHLQRTICSCL